MRAKYNRFKMNINILMFVRISIDYNTGRLYSMLIVLIHCKWSLIDYNMFLCRWTIDKFEEKNHCQFGNEE